HQQATTNQNVKKRPACSELRWAYCNHKATYFASYLTGGDCVPDDQNWGKANRKEGPEKIEPLGNEAGNSLYHLRPQKNTNSSRVGINNLANLGNKEQSDNNKKNIN